MSVSYRSRPTLDAGPRPALAIEGLSAGYGASTVLRDVSLRVEPSERVALVGANGAGKTTLLRAVSGLVRPQKGSITFGSVDLTSVPANRVSAVGVVHVPEGRQVFARQTVLENLLLGSGARRDLRKTARARLERLLDALPVLRDRLGAWAGDLSGGQQQILAIGRALMAEPRILMLDELSLGLAPRLVDEVADIVRDIAGRGDLSLLVVEQNAAVAIELTQRTYVMRNGAIAGVHDSRDLTDAELVYQYLGGEGA